jgi:hypothetical protein
MGLESRKCYHGVPRILANTYANKERPEVMMDEGWINQYENVENYLRTHRININVRQVYPTED